MLTDTKLKSSKPESKQYKVSDRDGLYIAVLPAVPSYFDTIAASMGGVRHSR
ncbi:putative integrase [Photorhabdus asymbiotica]|uniref:Integrase n=1 Tax=Photorhabdus asymbiotica subsp. asymbiotica (strain ATCC 43949 / 3105-77) TaxID=553480 RepID=C7BIB3_PHOAA|nr:putative integrase [Photorhabdus asymbiotica]